MSTSFSFCTAVALAGWVEGARDRVKLNLQRFPEDVWIRISSGDVYDELGVRETAIEFYVAALKMAAKTYDWEGVAERLQPALAKMGRPADWDDLKRRYPKPADPPVVPFAAGRGDVSPTARHPSGPIRVLTSRPSPEIVPVAAAAPLVAKRKIGRNAPCPCGSGKKYKKCCLGRE